jgi:hypothetical protein
MEEDDDFDFREPGDLPPGWFFFHEAVRRLQELFGDSRGAAQVRLRQALGNGTVRSMKAPTDEDASEMHGAPCVAGEKYWGPIAPREWREREVDYDPPSAFTTEAPGPYDGFRIVVAIGDFNYAFEGEASPEPKGTRKADLVRQAIEAVWPDGVPKDLLNKQIEREVGDWLKQQGNPPISRDTILRAAGRK